jgi:gamma-glutamyltranspeptidase/glutathione hydrolase
MSYKDALTRPVVYAANGMASSGHPLASLTAIKVLEAGGNVMDAAVAASAVLCVVDPAASGVGGDAFYTYHDAATGKLDSLVGSGRSARSADTERFKDGIPATGPLAPTVPGIVRGWEDALKRHGTTDLAMLLKPAIHHARAGFPVGARVAGAFRRRESALRNCPAAVDAFQRNGEWPEAGRMIQLPDLADSLETIAREGAAAFYTGRLTDRIVSGLAAEGGLLNHQDFADHESLFGEPLVVGYRGYQIAAPQPPTMGAILLSQLSLLERVAPQAGDWTSADWQHLMIEVKKASFGDLDAYLTDPAFAAVPPGAYLSSTYVDARSQSISRQTAALYGAGNIGARLGHTVSLAVSDRHGNMVSWIQSVFNEFGSCWMAPGTGFLLNNRMYGFSATPGHVNVVEPGKRTTHTLHCPMVLKDGKPVLAVSTPGDYGQTQSNLQMITNFIDQGFDIQRMIDAPRWRSLDGLTVAIESRFPQSVVDDLRARGHDMKVVDPFTDLMGGAVAVGIDRDRGSLAGAGDPRRECYAIGY